jgi:hypothetical protein
VHLLLSTRAAGNSYCLDLVQDPNGLYHSPKMNEIMNIAGMVIQAAAAGVATWTRDTPLVSSLVASWSQEVRSGWHSNTSTAYL